MYGMGLSHFSNSIQAAVTIESTTFTKVPDQANNKILAQATKLGVSFINNAQNKEHESLEKELRSGSTSSLKTSIDNTEQPEESIVEAEENRVSMEQESAMMSSE